MKGSDEPLEVDIAANIQLRHARQRRQDQLQRTTTQMGKNVIGIVLGFSCDALNERTLRKLGRIWHAGYQGPDTRDPGKVCVLIGETCTTDCVFLGVSWRKSQGACYLTSTKIKHSVRNSTSGQ